MWSMPRASSQITPAATLEESASSTPGHRRSDERAPAPAGTGTGRRGHGAEQSHLLGQRRRNPGPPEQEGLDLGRLAPVEVADGRGSVSTPRVGTPRPWTPPYWANTAGPASSVTA